MPKPLTMLNTIRGSRLDGFYPRGWDLARMDKCCAMSLKQLTTPARHWHREFKSVAVDAIATPMGDAIADVIERTRRDARKLALILPVGPVVMYGSNRAGRPPKRAPFVAYWPSAAKCTGTCALYDSS